MTDPYFFQTLMRIFFKITSDGFPVVRVPNERIGKNSKQSITICKTFSESARIRTEIDQDTANQMYHF